MCTGNICRSPMAEALLRDRLTSRGVPGRVHSAGLLDDGRPASGSGVEVMADRGLDLSGHRSRRLSAELIDGADLVLGMARAHVREAVVLAPAAWPRSFTLKELVRRGAGGGPRPPGQELADWLAKAHVGRDRRDLLGESPDDDVEDPIGAPRWRYERTAEELEDLCDRLASLLFDQEPSR